MPSNIEAHVAVPEMGLMGDNFARFAKVWIIPEFVERIHRSPYNLPPFFDRRWIHLVINFWVLPKAMRRLVKLCQTLKPDVIYCNHMLAKPVGAYVGWRLNIPTVFHARNISETSFGKWFYTSLAKLTCVKKVLSNSIATAKDFQDAVPQKVKVVHNFVDLALFNLEHVQKKLREDYAIPSQAILAGFSGRLVAKKGVEPLLQAFAKIYAENIDLYLVIMGGNDSGDQDYLSQYRRLAQHLKISDRVIFTGFVQDIRPYLADIDFMIMPSIQPEPFGRVLIEAMAYKIPNIATNHGGAIEVVKDGQSGILVTPNDVEDLAHAIATLARNTELRKKMGEHGYTRLITEFAPQNLAAVITQSLTQAAQTP